MDTIRSNDRPTLGEEALMDVDWSHDPVIAIQQMVSARDWIELKIEQAIGQARSDERSWADVAEPLGVTRQVAWRKYAHTID